MQGRSLIEVIRGGDYPADEFRSVMSEDGYGGQYYTKEDGTDYAARAPQPPKSPVFRRTEHLDASGASRCVRMGDWKLEFDMLGNGRNVQRQKGSLGDEEPLRQPEIRRQAAGADGERAMGHVPTTTRCRCPANATASSAIRTTTCFTINSMEIRATHIAAAAAVLTAFSAALRPSGPTSCSSSRTTRACSTSAVTAVPTP